ncbi:uncharacterized protein BDZ99DRAFT_3447 [Mytilinidion resinicola]|uniref:EGF-like domain-containing protein n=1 Tax=Mytilinidion resinicola TaxID=574789 RepID=A0A6A6Z9A4_9PEZI|nr:uncharacterized protein BDZ99DRAFT_3447 [Mytilinidion resinicola]KAF2816865.1 hypothetical protein BDZ99DRAFT_3447 [Mytilinidion resinicola]
MSYDRQADVPSGRSAANRDADGAKRGGSVRAARERLHAQRHQAPGGSPERTRIVGLPARPNQLVSHFSVQKPQQMPTPPSSSEGLATAVSPTPQWPLPNDADDAIDGSASQSQARSTDRRPPPQRPPRPSYVPDIVNHPRPTDLPTQQPQPVAMVPELTYQDDDYLSPSYGTMSSSSRPLTQSSAASEVSSLGSIPDFPIPAQPLPRRSPNIGPPPSARRGPSSYYSQMSYVSPIAEEAEINRSHHGSYASSNVIPSNVQDFYFDEDASPSDDDRPISVENGRESRAGDHDEQSGLVRQASIGRRTKPSLTTIKSGDSLRVDDRASSKRKAEKKKQGLVAQAAIAAGATGGAFAAGMGAAREQQVSRNSSRGSGGPGSGSLNSGTGLLDPSSSSSESLDSMKPKKNKSAGELRPIPAQTRSRSPLAPLDSKPAHSPRDYEKEDVDSPTHPLQMPTRQPSSLAERVGKRRPPRLNVDAVREAEARGSLTSLPDLIRRATRLAANLDRGKTASRLGMDFFAASDLEKRDGEHRTSGSLSDILASFPPPGLATPTGDYSPNNRHMSRWPSGLAMAETASMGDAEPRKSERRRRRCCGMPLWAFILLLIVLLLLVAAAVVIPIVLIVLPRMRDNKHSASNPGATSQASQCAASLACQNGGVAIVNPDASCSCLCTNGFTGKTCTSGTDSGCTTQDVDGIKSATLGNALPRLLEDSQANYSIPLNASLILSLFSSTNLSCTSENALVTFNGLSSRSVDFNLPLLNNVDSPPALSASIPALTPRPEARHIQVRQDRATSNGLIIAASATSPPTSTRTSGGSPAATETLATVNNATALDFARVGVLLVLQESREINTAVAAQENLQTFFEGRGDNSDNAGSVDLGSNFSIDLVNLTISLSNGTIVGSSAAGNATKTH